jgi:hemoglobin
MEIVFPRESERVTVGSTDFSFLDVKTVVDKFYRKVATDPVLQVPFRSVEDWPHHIERLTHFWWARFGGEPYIDTTYNPAAKHFLAGFNEEFLARWLALFKETLSSTLEPEQAELWGIIADRMGGALLAKDQMMRGMIPTKR